MTETENKALIQELIEYIPGLTDCRTYSKKEPAEPITRLEVNVVEPLNPGDNHRVHICVHLVNSYKPLVFELFTSDNTAALSAIEGSVLLKCWDDFINIPFTLAEKLILNKPAANLIEVNEMPVNTKPTSNIEHNEPPVLKQRVVTPDEIRVEQARYDARRFQTRGLPERLYPTVEPMVQLNQPYGYGPNYGQFDTNPGQQFNNQYPHIQMPMINYPEYMTNHLKYYKELLVNLALGNELNDEETLQALSVIIHNLILSGIMGQMVPVMDVIKPAVDENSPLTAALRLPARLHGNPAYVAIVFEYTVATRKAKALGIRTSSKDYSINLFQALRTGLISTM